MFGIFPRQSREFWAPADTVGSPAAPHTILVVWRTEATPHGHRRGAERLFSWGHTTPEEGLLRGADSAVARFFNSEGKEVLEMQWSATNGWGMPQPARNPIAKEGWSGDGYMSPSPA